MTVIVVQQASLDATIASTDVVAYDSEAATQSLDKRIYDLSSFSTLYNSEAGAAPCLSDAHGHHDDIGLAFQRTRRRPCMAHRGLHDC